MKASCSTCLELLHSSDDLTSPPCGHVLHVVCLAQWFETGKHSCPQCRRSCREDQLRRVYLSESADAAGAQAHAAGDEAHVAAIQAKADSLAFDVRCRTLELTKAKEERDAAVAHSLGLKDEVHAINNERKTLKEDLTAARSKVKYLQADKENATLAKREADDLRSKLELYRNIDLVVQGSIGEVNDKLHEMGDFSRASRELSIIIAALKRELKAKADERAQLKAELRDKVKFVSELKATLAVQSRDLAELQRSNRGIASDLRHVEDERASLKQKVRVLQESIDSPSADPRKSAIRRIMAESPAPMNLSALEEAAASPTPAAASRPNAQASKSPSQSSSSSTSQPSSSSCVAAAGASPPFLQTKSCSILGLQKLGRSADPTGGGAAGFAPNPLAAKDFNILAKKRRLAPNVKKKGGSQLLPTETAVATFSDVKEQFYNGFGGHQKLDEFPKPRARMRFNVKPLPPPMAIRGLKKTKSIAKAPTKNNAATIDKYFGGLGLETP